MYAKKKDPSLCITVKTLDKIEGHVRRMLRHIALFLKAQDSTVFKPQTITVKARIADEEVRETWMWRWKALGVAVEWNEELKRMVFKLDVEQAKKLQPNLPKPRPEGNPHLFPNG